MKEQKKTSPFRYISFAFQTKSTKCGVTQSDYLSECETRFENVLGIYINRSGLGGLAFKRKSTVL
jgi:hypothetical protein